MLRDTLRRSSFTLLAALLAASGVAVSLSACSENPVGRKCDLGVDNPNPNEAVLASPSLDCQSRTCLKVPLQRDLPPGSEYPSGNIGLCTADCEQDSDCPMGTGCGFGQCRPRCEADADCTGACAGGFCEP